MWGSWQDKEYSSSSLGRWLPRELEQPRGLADPGWHHPWVHGVEQGLGEQAVASESVFGPEACQLDSWDGKVDVVRRKFGRVR